MKNTYPFYIVFQVLNIHLIKTCKIKPLIKYRFSSQFFFFNGFTQPSSTPLYHALNCQNSLSVKKVFCWCSLNSSEGKEYVRRTLKYRCTLKWPERLPEHFFRWEWFTRLKFLKSFRNFLFLHCCQNCLKIKIAGRKGYQGVCNSVAKFSRTLGLPFPCLLEVKSFNPHPTCLLYIVSYCGTYSSSKFK